MMLLDPLRLLLAMLACYRLSRLLAWEEGPLGIFEALREWLGSEEQGHDGQPATLWGRLAICPYCWGVWLAGALSFPVLYPLPLTDAFLLAFGIAGAQAYLQGTSD